MNRMPMMLETVKEARGLLNDLKEVYRMRQLDKGQQDAQNTGDTTVIEGALAGRPTDQDPPHHTVNNVR